MNKIILKSQLGWMPSREQELLLKTALLEGTNCIKSWEKWKTITDIERLDGGSQKLLPLVLYNLKKNGLEDPLYFKKMKSVSIKTWYINRMFFSQLAGIIKDFEASGIDSMILKGVSLASLYYPNTSIRPMGDFDLLVPWESSKKSGDILFSQGWDFKAEPIYKIFNDSYKITNNAIGFAKNGIECDLHWSVLKHTCYPEADSEFWERSRAIEIQGIKTRTLSPEDQFIHILENGGYWNDPPPIKWIADSYLLLNCEKMLDWDYFVYKIKEKYLDCLFLGMLEYLNETFSTEIPETVISHLAAVPPNTFNYRLLSFARVPESNISLGLRRNLKQFLHFRIYYNDYLKGKKRNVVLIFFKFLFFRWELKNPLFFPFVFVRRLGGKIYRFTKWKLLGF